MSNPEHPEGSPVSAPLGRGLYVITDPALQAAGRLAERVEQAILGGARVVQYRDKGPDPQRRRAEAQALLAVCRRLGPPLIINDDVELAAALGADGVHIGRDDAGLALARRRLGPRATIGVSCYDRLDLALEAQAAGATYVAFGRFFPSATKPQAVQATVDLLVQARAALHLPIVAIGGITPDNGGSLIAAGADALAVIEGVFAQADIRAAAERYARLFHD
jgi:thiamine-phosphate pyrophosphorylase